jgi:hypothetical protein
MATTTEAPKRRYNKKDDNIIQIEEKIEASRGLFEKLFRHNFPGDTKKDYTSLLFRTSFLAENQTRYLLDKDDTTK